MPVRKPKGVTGRGAANWYAQQAADVGELLNPGGDRETQTWIENWLWARNRGYDGAEVFRRARLRGARRLSSVLR